MQLNALFLEQACGPLVWFLGAYLQHPRTREEEQGTLSVTPDLVHRQVRLGAHRS